MSPTFRTVVPLTVLFVLTAAHAQEPAQLLERLKAAVRSYETIVRELDLNRIPGNMTGYPQATESLDQLGGRLEGLSRVAGHTETLQVADWRKLVTDLDAFETDLARLRHQSLPLRVWSYFDAHGHEKPDYGFAIASALVPLPRSKGRFDATATNEVKLHVSPGETATTQVIVVPLAKSLRSILVTSKALTGPAGSLSARQVQCRPIDYGKLPTEFSAPESKWWQQALSGTKTDIAQDLSHAYILTIEVPAQQKPGVYAGPLYFSPANAKAMALHLTLEVASPQS